MISFDYKPQGVCARNIHLDLSDDGNKVMGVEFTGGRGRSCRSRNRGSRR